MTIGKATLFVAGFIGAVALGVAIGPSLTQREAAVTAPDAVTSQPAAVPDVAPRAAAPRASAPKRVTSAAALIPPSTPALQERLKPVLNRGTNMTMAAEGFRDAEQFATVAHAARNTEVPFVLLKHRVLDEGRSLADAIRASKPDVDAAGETSRAATEARADIAAISSSS